jgi:hypothetical protein
MTEEQRRLVELDRKKDDIKRFFDEYAEALAAVVEKHGTGTFFQDDQGVVYRVIVPEGRYVYFDKYSVERTRRSDERTGSLSLKKAREAGFVVEGE